VTFEDNYVQTNKNRLMLSVKQMFSRESSFLQYKVYADIHEGSLEDRRKTTVGLCVNAHCLLQIGVA